jgi:mycothiol synthase
VIWTSRLDDRAPDVLALAERALMADGVAPLSGHVLDALGLGTDEYLVLPERGAVTAVAVVHDSDPAEIVVDPVHRRAGLGRALLTAALDRTGAVWAHGDLLPARALAASSGLVRTRELLQMRRPLDPAWAAAQVERAPLPAGVRIRTFVPGQDEQQFLGVNARAFDWHPEQGRLDRSGLDLEMAQPWFDPAGFFLAVDADDTLLGFHWTKVHSPEITRADAPAAGQVLALGEVYVLGVDPAGQLDGNPVRGLGAPLTAAGLRYLAARGLSTVLLYVEGDNEPALRLYRRLGFTTYSTDVVYRRPV